MKRKFCVYGNCQIYSLKACLKQSEEFNACYEEIPLKPVFELSEHDLPYLEKVVSEADLFIHQPISNNYKGIEKFSTEYLKSLLKFQSKAISFPVAYFTGYHPELFYLKDENGNILDKPFPYHDVNILNFYIQGAKIDEILTAIKSKSFYDQKYLEDNLEKTIYNLSIREKEIDVKISQFIKDNYKNIKLFHTINHPHISVINFIAQKILENLHFEVTDINYLNMLDGERGNKTDYHVYLSVLSNLNLSFDSKFEYRIRKKTLVGKDLIKSFLDFYDSNPSLVEKAKKRIQSKEMKDKKIVSEQLNVSQNAMRVPSKVSALKFLRDSGLNVGTVLDVGVRDKTEELITLFPDVKHILFEPVEEFREHIKLNYEGLDYELIQAAVSNEDAEGFLDVRRKNKSGNITHSKVVKQNISDTFRTINKVTLDSFLKSKNYQEPYLLKIDVDGHEMAVLRGALESLKRASCIIIEAPLVTLFERLRLLTREGFVLWDIVDFTYYRQNLYQVDLIFLNQAQRDTKFFDPRKYFRTDKIDKNDWESLNRILNTLN